MKTFEDFLNVQPHALGKLFDVYVIRDVETGKVVASIRGDTIIGTRGQEASFEVKGNTLTLILLEE
jgi:hypothetical protein